MSDREFLVIQVFFGICSGFFMFLYAVFQFWETWQDSKQDKTRNWLINYWFILSDTRWSEIPEVIVRWLLELKKHIEESLLSLQDLSFRIIAPFVLAIIGIYTILNRSLYGSMLIVILIIYSLCHVYSQAKKVYETALGVGSVIFHVTRPKVAERWAVLSLLMLACTSIATMVFMNFLLSFKNIWTTISLAMLIPYFLVLFNVFRFLVFFIFTRPQEGSKTLDLDQKNSIETFGLGFSISFPITMLAITIGAFIHSGTWEELKTLVVLLVNAICDGATILITFTFLIWAIEKKSIYRLPLAICADFVFSSLLAFCSLYLSLLLSSHPLTAKETINVFFALSSDGEGIELGPYFWVMHTTFIPTILVLFCVFMGWVAKVVIIPFRRYFAKGAEHTNPLKLTAHLCAAVGGGFAFLAAVLVALEKI